VFLFLYVAAKHPKAALLVQPVFRPVNPSSYNNLLELFQTNSLSTKLFFTEQEYVFVEQIYLNLGSYHALMHNLDISATVDTFFLLTNP